MPGHPLEGNPVDECTIPRGTDEVMPGTSVFPSSETSVLGNFWGRIKGAKYRIAIALQDGT